jgi:hypothetical protein
LIPGYNHNIRYRDQVFHVQTEDSGPRNPVFVTHLFIGGTILATNKSSYADVVQQPGFEDELRTRMQEQHKAMLRNLISGNMDHVIGHLWADAAAPEASPADTAPLSPPPVLPVAPAVPPPPPPEARPAARVPTIPVSGTPRVAPAHTSTVSTHAGSAGIPAEIVSPLPVGERVAPLSVPHAPVAPRPAIPAQPVRPVLRGSSVSAPPQAPPLVAVAPRPSEGFASRSPPTPAAAPAQAPPTPAVGGPIPTYPGAPLGGANPFGGIVSDKSLDDVILRYLAAELEDGGDKDDNESR